MVFARRSLAKIFAAAAIVLAPVVFGGSYLSEGRELTDGEREMVTDLFDSAIDLDKVKIKYGPAFLFMSKSTNMVLGNTYFVSDRYGIVDDFSKVSVYQRACFMHEITHIWQSQQGKSLPFEALQEFLKHDCDYSDAYEFKLDDVRSFGALGIEQQASILECYFKEKALLREGGASSDKRYIAGEQMQPHKFLSKVDSILPVICTMN